MNSRPKKQHYVPQMLLRGFAVPTKDQIWVFDKSKGTSYISAIRDAASENYFNEVEIGGYTVSFEERLELVEAYAAPVIKKIIASESINNLSAEDQASLVVFIATQMVRTNAGRVAMDQAHDLLVAKLGGEERAMKAGVPPRDRELQKLAILKDLPETINQFAKPLAEKLYVLQKTRGESRFLIGDDPIALDNNILPRENGWGNLGIANQGIEIYLPLTPKLALSLMCPSVLTLMEKAKASRSHFASFEAERFIHALESGTSFLLSYQNVRRLNSIQIAKATRFVMSDIDDFSLAKEMIADRPEFASTPRYVS